jgi:sec-independent protein translocase protein TatA
MGGGLFQPGHLIVVLIIALIIFGPGKLPELGSALGQGIREFKRSVEHLSQDDTPPQAGGTLPASQPSAVPSATAATVSVPGTNGSIVCARCQGSMPASHQYCTSCGSRLGQG